MFVVVFFLSLYLFPFHFEWSRCFMFIVGLCCCFIYTFSNILSIHSRIVSVYSQIENHELNIRYRPHHIKAFNSIIQLHVKWFMLFDLCILRAYQWINRQIIGSTKRMNFGVQQVQAASTYYFTQHNKNYVMSSPCILEPSKYLTPKIPCWCDTIQWIVSIGNRHGPYR